jgi:mannose-6-phosphate isomerase-like protein (cupin superfamily)
MVINRANAEHYTWGQACDGWRLADQPGLSVIEERMPPGAAEAWHVHQQARQLFYVLEGQLSIEQGEERCTLSAGDGLEMSPGTPHRVLNDTPADVRFLVISAPSTRGDRINLPAS